jgi:predicted N-acetyltransferase YhbS
MVMIRNEKLFDIEAREALLDQTFGDQRFAKASERLREGRLPADRLSFVACQARQVIGTVRLWNVSAGPGRAALMLGPLVVAADCRKRGTGAALVGHALRVAQRLGHGAVLLVGDAPYYGRFGFSAEKTAGLWMPGPYERDRLLAHELVAGALDGARGLVGATGRRQPKPDLALLVAGLRQDETARAPRAA